MLQAAERFQAVRADMLSDRFYTSDVNIGGRADDDADDDIDDDVNDEDNGKDDITSRRCHSSAFGWTRQAQ